MKPEENDFRLDRKARSFRISNFTLPDFALLVATFAFLTLVGIVFGSIPSQILPESLPWFGPVGLLLIAFAVTGLCWFQQRSNQSRQDLSAELQSTAKDSANLVATIQQFQAEHPKVSAVLAKQRIEEFSRTGV